MFLLKPRSQNTIPEIKGDSPSVNVVRSLKAQLCPSNTPSGPAHFLAPLMLARETNRTLSFGPSNIPQTPTRKLACHLLQEAYPDCFWGFSSLCSHNTLGFTHPSLSVLICVVTAYFLVCFHEFHDGLRLIHCGILQQNVSEMSLRWVVVSSLLLLLLSLLSPSSFASFYR